MGADGQNRFIILDAMRGIAAISIVIYHSSNNLLMAYAGVDLFFMLSGFVLAHSYGEQLSDRAFRGEFIRRRIVRIYPLYLIAFFCGAIVTWHLTDKGLPDWDRTRYFQAVVPGLVMLPSPCRSWLMGSFPINGPSWSLFFEALANLVFAFTGWRVRPALILAALSAPLLLVVIHTWEGAGGFSYEDFLGGFPRVVFSFFAGVLLYRVWLSGRLPRVRLPAVLPLAAIPAAYAWFPGAEGTYHAAIVFLLNPLLIWLGAAATANGTGRSLAKWLGDISYATYVFDMPIQLFVVSALYPAMGLRFTDGPPGVLVLIVLPLVLLAGHVGTFHIDKPLRRMLNRRLVPVAG